MVFPVTSIGESLDMADDENNTTGRKTRSLGTLPVQKLESKKEFKTVWSNYVASAKAFAEAKNTSSTNKQKVKDLLKKIPSLKNVEQIDFIIQPGGHDIAIFEVVSKGPRKSRATEIDFE
jgi:hypothetical protein